MCEMQKEVSGDHILGWMEMTVMPKKAGSIENIGAN